MGLLDSRGNAIREFNLPHDSAAAAARPEYPTVVDVELKTELKKMNKNFKQIIELKKQSKRSGRRRWICRRRGNEGQFE